MTCNECRERLQELADNELVPRERKAIEAHLSDCPTCAREFKEVAHFTTSVAQAVRPIRPSAELSSKVLTVYQESRAQLKAAPSTTLKRQKPIPTWWWLTGIGTLVLAGIVVLLWPGDSQNVGKLESSSAAVRVMEYASGKWTRAERKALRPGDRIEVPEHETKAPKLGLQGWGTATLHPACAIQLERSGETLILRVLQQAPGRIDLVTQPTPAAGTRRIRVAWGSAWVELNSSDENEVSIDPLTGEGGGWTGQLRATVMRGAAHLGNTAQAQTVGEGFYRVVPQSGDCEAAQKVE